MFGMLESLTKSIVATALTPVALAVDIVTLPMSATDGDKPFSNTESLIDSAKDNFNKAIS
jgi:hypothetical protein